MLTFISGWRSIERDKALLNHRDPARQAVFFVDNQSGLPHVLPSTTPLVDLWRHGRADFSAGEECETIVRVNHDTEDELLVRAITHALIHHPQAQVVVMYDANDSLARLYPALRNANALMAADARFDAPIGDRVLFTRGGSFRWRDNFIESQTALLTDGEVYDAGIVPDPEEPGDYDRYFDYSR
jgi:hypothetical protein